MSAVRKIAAMLLVPISWAALNAGHRPLIDPASFAWSETFRAAAPLVVLTAGILVWRRGRSPAQSAPFPLVLFSLFGLLGTLVALTVSPERGEALVWGVSYLSVPVLWMGLYAAGRETSVQAGWWATLGIVTAIAAVVFTISVAELDLLGHLSGNVEHRLFNEWRHDPIHTALRINPNGAARFSALAAIAGAGLVFGAERQVYRPLGLIPVAALTPVVLAAESRTALVGLIVGLVLLVLLYLGWRWTLLTGGLVGATLWATGVLTAIKDVVLRAGLEHLVTFSNRLGHWRSGFELFLGNPLFGLGFRADRILLDLHLHNALLQSLVTAGTLGGLLFVGAWLLAWSDLVDLGLLERFSSVPIEQRRHAVVAAAVLAFLTLRGLSESTGAFYGVDFLVLVPTVAKIRSLKHHHLEEPSSKRPDWSVSGDPAAFASRRKILVSAFACCPPRSRRFRGGEDMLGWSLVDRLADHHHLHVLTAERNRQDLEPEAGDRDNGSLTFHYVGLPGPLGGLDGRRGSNQLHAYLWQLRILPTAVSLHRRIDFDLFHHITYANDWMASFVGALLPIPYVRGPGGSGPSIPPPFMSGLSPGHRVWQTARQSLRAIFRLDPVFQLGQARADCLLVCNPQAMDRLSPDRRRKAVYLPVTGISPDDVSSAAVNVDPEDEGPIEIVSAGKLLPSKGFATALRTFARFLERGGTGHYSLVGDGPEREGLEQLTRELGIEDDVTFLGWLPNRNDVLRKMREADVFLYPSFHDGGGAVVVEAMASGIPVVTFEIGGPGLHVTSETGYAIDPVAPGATEDELADALLRLEENPKLRMVMGEAGRQRAHTLYLWDDLATRVREVYDEVLVESDGGGRPGS